MNSRTPPIPSRDEALSGAILSTTARLRRALRRTATHHFPGPDVPRARAELLRYIGRNPGRSITEAAEDLGLAANTVSTMVSALGRAGDLVRASAPTDRRIALLSLSPALQREADQARAARRDAVSRALAELSDEDRRRLHSGLEILSGLTDRILALGSGDEASR